MSQSTNAIHLLGATVLVWWSRRTMYKKWLRVSWLFTNWKNYLSYVNRCGKISQSASLLNCDWQKPFVWPIVTYGC